MQARVLGIGEVIPPLDHTGGALDLMVGAARAAMNDAGLGPGAIDGVVVTSRASLPNLMHPTEGGSYVAEYLGILPCMPRTLAYGGPGGLSAVTEAMMMIDAGLAQRVLVISGDAARRDKSIAGIVELYASGMREIYEQPFGATTATAYALAATRHMALYGTTPEQMAAVPVSARRHARRNPAALFPEPLSVDDVLSSRMITTPLRLLDCCQMTDGAAAVVIGSAAASPHAAPGVRLVAGKEVLTHQSVTLAPDVLDLGCSRIAEGVFAEANIKREDVDAVYLYDNFSIHPILQLESLGFCGPGEGPDLVSSGAIDPGGDLPMNTHGGLFGCVNPGMPAQLFFLTEATQQLRGTAGERQVRNAEVSVLSAPGGYQSWYQVIVALAD